MKHIEIEDEETDAPDTPCGRQVHLSPRPQSL